MPGKSRVISSPGRMHTHNLPMGGRQGLETMDGTGLDRVRLQGVLPQLDLQTAGFINGQERLFVSCQ